MKLCVDCKLAKYSKDPEYARCTLVLDPVTGAPVRYCSTERAYGKCGSEGKYFEQKPGNKSLWQTLFSYAANK